MGVELTQQFNGMDNLNLSDSELVHHVREALITAKTGDTENYHQLVGIMHHSKNLGPDAVALLVTSLKGLSGSVPYIDIVYHESLLNSVFGMCIWNYQPDVMDALLELIVSLAASNVKFVDACLEMLVNNFVPPIYLIDAIKQPRGQVKKEQVISRLHTALQNVAALVPMAAMRLSTVVVHKMPRTFKKDIEMDQLRYRTEIYVENMLRLESGAIREFVGSRMIMAVVDMLIELDVAIGWDDILQDDSTKGIFSIELEDDDDIGSDGEENDIREFPGTITHKSLSKNVVANLLDGLMVRTFEHLESCVSDKRLSEVFETLLDSFMLTILNTYKSKFAQFVMFYACSLDPENCGVKFAKALADRFLNGDNPLTRMSAVAYLASYLARAKFLSSALVASTLKRLLDWCLEYCKSQDGHMNPKAHRVFYSGCQAIMYVLCFRMRTIMDVPGLKSRHLLRPMEPILRHKLHPLQVCLPSIVEEFLKQAKAAHLFTTPETIISENLLESEFSRDFGGLERLDMFFPFDPCLLRTCDRNFIRPNFVYWKHVRTTYGSDEEYSSDEEIAEEFDTMNGEAFMEEGMGGCSDDEDLDLDEFDMNKMSITPKNGLNYRMQMPSRIRPSTSPESL